MDEILVQVRKYRRYDPLAVLAYIAAYQQTHDQRSPSERRIQDALTISAPSVVHAIIQRLVQDALIVVTRYGRGSGVDLRLTEEGQAAVERWRAEHPTLPPNGAQPQ
jgi:Mn-dependent DtxR family transcriptional regulator